MTIIVGIEHPGGVTLAADSQGTAGSAYMVELETPKLVRKSTAGYEAILGYTGSFRMGQVLHYNGWPKRAVTKDVDRWMATHYVDHVRKQFSKAGWLSKSHEREEGGRWLFAVANRLYVVEETFQVLRNACGFAACGSGSAYALGALHTMGLDEIHHDPARAAERAVEAAIAWTPGCGGTIYIEELAT